LQQIETLSFLSSFYFHSTSSSCRLYYQANQYVTSSLFYLFFQLFALSSSTQSCEIFHCGSEWSVMLETMNSQINKHSLILSDLIQHPLSSDSMLCKSGSGEASQVCVTLGAGPAWCSWCNPLQLGCPRGKLSDFKNANWLF
jgi:hypothetical protein